MSSWTLARLTQPDFEPVTLAEMKAHLRAYATVTEEDDQIISLIAMARAWYENYTGRALVDQQWRQTVECYADSDIILQRSPVLSVVSMLYTRRGGGVGEVDWRLSGQETRWPRIVPLVGFGNGPCEVLIEYRAGFVDRTSSPPEGAEKVPETAKMAIKLYAEAHYDRDLKTMQMLISAAQRLADLESAQLRLA